jgi:carbon monoxide dehydrogenase subunit G
VKARRETVLPVGAAEVWATVGDPGALPRWWPRVERVETVDAAGFTEVFRAKSGRTVRADYRIATLEDEREIRVVQQLEGTPFERILAASSKRAQLEPVEGGGTRVRLELDQTPAGMARFGGFLVRRAMRRQLDDALAALRALLDAPVSRA